MNPQTSTPAPPHLNQTNETLAQLPLRTLQNLTRTTQQTIWRYIHPHFSEPPTAAAQLPAIPTTPASLPNTQDPNPTLPLTSIPHVVPTSQNSIMPTNVTQHPLHQRPLQSE